MTPDPEQRLPRELLKELIEEGSDAFRGVLEKLLNTAMQMEREEFLGARRWERSEQRRDHANGYKAKTLSTRVGQLQIRIPQVRHLDFYPRSLERGCRSEKALKLAIAEMYVMGVSTRKVTEITEQLCGTEISASQVSRISKLLDDELEQFRNRPLGSYPVVYLDAHYEKVRRQGSIQDVAVLKATGVRRCLSQFLQQLQKRGLEGVQLTPTLARKAALGSVSMLSETRNLRHPAPSGGEAPSAIPRPQPGACCEDGFRQIRRRNTAHSVNSLFVFITISAFFVFAFAQEPQAAVSLDGFDLSCPTSVNERGTVGCTLENTGAEAKDWPVVGILHLSSDANRALVRGSPLDLQLATPDPSSEIDGGLWWIGSVLVAYSRFDWQGRASAQASRTVSIIIEDDDEYEDNEIFYVSLASSGSRGVGFLYTNRQAITISSSDSANSDAQLKTLEISTPGGEVSLDFSSDTTSYTATVAYEVTEAVVTPVANHKRAAIAVDGEPVESGETSPAIPLSVGNTAIEVAVTAEGATTKTYGIAVTRQTKTENMEVEADGFTLTCPSSVNEGASISCTLTNTQISAAEWPVVAIIHSSADGDARALIEEDPLIPKSSPAFGVDLRLSETQNPARENYNHGYGELFSGGSTSVYTTYGYQKFDWSGQGALSAERSVVIQTMADDEVESAEIFYIAVAPSGYTGLSRLVDNKAPIIIERNDMPDMPDMPDLTPPTVNTIAISSDPGSDRIYAPEDEIEATVTFSETVEVEGAPQLMLKVGDRNRPVGYLEGTGTTALVFAYEVAEGDEDTDGVSIEVNSLSLGGGTIKDGADNDAVLDHDGLAADSGHKVDAVKPELAATGGAVVNATTLTLTYDEPLDGSSTPVSGDFTVPGVYRARTVTGVRVNGSAVELTLDVGAEHGEAGIQVSYTPGTNPIRDVPGNAG